jgi:beta-lactamase regulating signal transducer with metallopeptidase domain
MNIWLASFLVHSTLWFSLAWLSTRLVPRMHPQTRETLWYTAIAISLVTPSIHVLAPSTLPAIWHLTLPGALFQSLEPGLAGGEHGMPTPANLFGLTWEVALIGAWASTATVLLGRYLTRIVMLRKRLARQDLSKDSKEWMMLRELSRRAGLGRVPRLTESENLGSPIAIGMGPLAEICVPTRALHELDQEEFTAMLGHEMAHHQRHDPVRLGLMNVLRGLLFFQPLFRLAGRDIQWAAEEQCDALAAEHVQNRLAMARCLTEVAGWVLPREQAVPVVGMAGGRSHLVRRVDRLMEDGDPTQVRAKSWHRIWSILVLFLALWVAPGFSPAAEVPHRDIEAAEPRETEHSLEHRDEALGASGEHNREARQASSGSQDEHSPQRRTEGREEHKAEGPEARGGEHGGR